ncbi:conserved hypothetical protein [Ricinus communis]|uniref:Uncharacterized protein n=1 Tax=Ricinus communis TaxID=3988 RepID=B9SYD7_RICCO|nr:conserved hypothetical protein [Ricinus communis]
MKKANESTSAKNSSKKDLKRPQPSQEAAEAFAKEFTKDLPLEIKKTTKFKKSVTANVTFKWNDY